MPDHQTEETWADDLEMRAAIADGDAAILGVGL
jgi:hypothetical protein